MSRCESPPACVRVKDAFVQTASEALEGVPVFFSTISGARLGPYKILRGDPLEAVRPRLRKCFAGRSGMEMSLSIDGKKWSKDFFLCMQCAVLACINKYKTSIQSFRAFSLFLQESDHPFLDALEGSEYCIVFTKHEDADYLSRKNYQKVIFKWHGSEEIIAELTLSDAVTLGRAQSMLQGHMPAGHLPGRMQLQSNDGAQRWLEAPSCRIVSHLVLFLYSFSFLKCLCFCAGYRYSIQICSRWRDIPSSLDQRGGLSLTSICSIDRSASLQIHVLSGFRRRSRACFSSTLVVLRERSNDWMSIKSKQSVCVKHACTCAEFGLPCT